MKIAVFSLFAFLAIVGVKAAEKARYDNYRVYEILIESEEQLEVMQQIENFPDGVSNF